MFCGFPNPSNQKLPPLLELDFAQLNNQTKHTDKLPQLSYTPELKTRKSNGMVSRTRNAATSIRNDLLRLYDYCSVHELHDDVASLMWILIVLDRSPLTGKPQQRKSQQGV